MNYSVSKQLLCRYISKANTTMADSIPTRVTSHRTRKKVLLAVRIYINVFYAFNFTFHKRQAAKLHSEVLVVFVVSENAECTY
jgi:hypothetical protein